MFLEIMSYSQAFKCLWAGHFVDQMADKSALAMQYDAYNEVYSPINVNKRQPILLGFAISQWQPVNYMWSKIHLQDQLT